MLIIIQPEYDCIHNHLEITMQKSGRFYFLKKKRGTSRLKKTSNVSPVKLIEMFGDGLNLQYFMSNGLLLVI